MSDTTDVSRAEAAPADSRPFAGTRAEGAPKQDLTLAVVGRLFVGAVVLGALLVGVGMLLTRVSDSWSETEGAVNRWFVLQRVDMWNAITLVASDMAKTATVIGVAGVAIVVFRLWLRRWHESLVLAIALMGEVVIFITVAAIVARERPPVFRLDPAPPTSSFPSGHTAAAVTVYGFIAFVIWRYAANRYLATLACVLLVAVPVAVGLARLYRGAHYPSDVVGGAVLGLTWLTFVIVTLMPSEPRSQGLPAG